MSISEHKGGRRTHEVGDVVRAEVRPTTHSPVGHVAKSRPVVIVEVRAGTVVALPISTKQRAGRDLCVAVPGDCRRAFAFDHLVEIATSSLPAHRLTSVGQEVLAEIDRMISAGTVDRSAVDRRRPTPRSERRRTAGRDMIDCIPEPEVMPVAAALAAIRAARRARIEDALGLGA